MSRTKASFSHLQLSVSKGSLAQKLGFHDFSCPFLKDISLEKSRVHNFHFQFWRDVSNESFVFTSSTCCFLGKSRTKASSSHLQLSVFEERLGRKLRFALHFPFKMPPLKRLQNRTFLASAPRSGFGAGLGQEKLLSCQRNSTGLCTLVLANCIGVAASLLLYVFAAHVVP
jgi:hypothetical protein